MNGSSSPFIENYNRAYLKEPALCCAAVSLQIKRHEDGTPFDSQGAGTSDLDVTLVGRKAMEMWDSGAYYLPGLHTKPLCDKEPDIAPNLNPLRESLQKLVGRPVNMQATSSLVLYGRDVLFGEPYFVVVPSGEDA